MSKLSIKKILCKFFSIRRHWIMKADIIEDANDKYDDKVVLVKVNQPYELIDGTYSKKLQSNLIKNNPKVCETYILKDSYNGKIIGTLSVMYKGGNELEYKIRNIDAFLYNALIRPEYRGKGYVVIMIKLVEKELRLKSIHEVFLAISADNTSALSAYKKAGFETIKKRTFVRALRRNIPYYSL